MQPTLPAPTDPQPRWRKLRLTVGETAVVVRDDAYSDRIRCDHPKVDDGRVLGSALLEAAESTGRGRVVVLAPAHLERGLETAGLTTEARMPGFYGGAEECAVMGAALDPERSESDAQEALRRVDTLLHGPVAPSTHPAVPTEVASPSDAEAIAELIGASFEHYPTPSGVPEYIAKQIEDGTPFRVVRDGSDVVAVASADIVAEARTAELTDCATAPEHRGRGLMQSVLRGLVDDLRERRFPTAFTLARAAIPGINVAFRRLGFTWRGRMVQSCRIGRGLEDMNVWSRTL